MNEPIEQAAARGHTVVYDPTHELSRVHRWTCTACGRAVLSNEGTVYGSAVEKPCVVAPGTPYNLRDTSTTPVLEEPLSEPVGALPAIRAKSTQRELFSDGNVFAILGKARRLLKDAGADKAYLDAFIIEASAGNYDQLLATVLRYIDLP